jgi:hypothetical protein
MSRTFRLRLLFRFFVFSIPGEARFFIGLPGLFPILSGESDAIVSRHTRSLHYGDNRLVCRLGIRIDDYHRVHAAASRSPQFLLELHDIPELDGRPVDHVVPGRAYRDIDDIRLLAGFFEGGLRQSDFQFRKPGVGGGYHQENQDDKQHIDHRHQIDFRIFFVPAALEIHDQDSME